MMLHEKRSAFRLFNDLWIIIFSIVFASLSLLTPHVFAHKVYLFAWVEDDTVFTESYFGSKNRVKGGLIKVFDPSGKKLLEGKTNQKGEFSFKIPKKVDLLIVLEATMGHGAEYILKTGELPEAASGSDLAIGKEESQSPLPSSGHVDVEQIRVVVEKALDARLRPIVRTLAIIQEERGPGLTEILGGLGYILGIMGLILYFKSREKDRGTN